MSQQQQQSQMGRTDTMTNLYSTSIDLPEETRVEVIQALNQVLADTTDLRTQAKFAHWNVKGYDFYQFHLLFDEIAETLEGHVDRIAERITALGGQAMGTTRIAAKTSRLPEPPVNAAGEDEYVGWLTDHVAHHANGLRMFIERTQRLGDEDTADLLSDISLDVDRLVYLLEPHLQAEVKDQVPATAGQGSSIPVQSATSAQAQGGASSQAGGRQGARQISVSSSDGQSSGTPGGLTQVMDAGQPMRPQSSVPQDVGQPTSAPRDIPQGASQPPGQFEDVGHSFPTQQAPSQPPQSPPDVGRQTGGMNPPRSQEGGGQQPQQQAPPQQFDQPPSQQGPGASQRLPEAESQQYGTSRGQPQQMAPQQEFGQPMDAQQELGQQSPGLQQPPGGMRW